MMLRFDKEVTITINFIEDNEGKWAEFNFRKLIDHQTHSIKTLLPESAFDKNWSYMVDYGFRQINKIEKEVLEDS